MTGKRPRLMMRRTVSMASLGAGSDAPKPDHVPHQVIGFAPKAFSDNGTTNSMPVEEDSDAAEAAAAPATAKSRPFSGLSSLADANATKDAAAHGGSICSSGEKVGLGILAALDKDAPSCSPPGTIIRSMGSPAAAAAQPPSFKPGCFPEAMSICSKEQQQQQQARQQFDFVFQANSGHRKSDRCSSRTTTLEFLESCYLCKRDISFGRDIYMYRGDRAFCSVECRHQQIVNDERVERRDKCSSAALKQMGGGGVNQQPRHVTQRAKVTQATTAAAA